MAGSEIFWPGLSPESPLTYIIIIIIIIIMGSPLTTLITSPLSPLLATLSTSWELVPSPISSLISKSPCTKVNILLLVKKIFCLPCP